MGVGQSGFVGSGCEAKNVFQELDCAQLWALLGK